MNMKSAHTIDQEKTAAKQAVVIEQLVAGEDAHWNLYVSLHSQATIYHLSEWRQLIGRVFGHDDIYLCARRGTEIIGVLPLIRLKSLLFGDYLVSMPYFNYGGVISDSPDVDELLIAAAVTKAEKMGCGHIELRDTVQRSSMPVRTDKVSMELTLPGDSESLWAAFPPKLRAQIRKPKKEGAEFIQGGVELLPDFYEVFSRNMRDLGTPVYPISFFREILATFPNHARIVLVRYQNKPVASGFLLGYGERLEIPWASSLREHNSLGVNMLMYAETLMWASGHGYKLFDFGRSTLDSGTYRFKKQWGAEARQLYWHYWVTPGQGIPKLTTSNPKYQLAISAWKRLPLFVANRLGPAIVKNLP